MKQKNIQRILIAVLLVVEFCFMFLSVKSYVNKDVEEIQEGNEVDSKTFAMYVENDEGNYEETIDTGVFPEGYILNLEMTSCIDNKGNNVDDILTLRDDKVTVKSNKTVFCYLYFDKDNRVFAQVKRDYKNSNGALLLSETESDEYPVYYYSGNITNNNILYANFCWKMVRTTETGGVKLIYNGVPDEAEDGTLTCDNTGTESQIGTSTFNSLNNSPAYVGYMYNTIYKITKKGFTSNDVVLYRERYAPLSSYYGDTVTWDGSKYVLSNSDGSEVKTYSWEDEYSNLKEFYTCFSEMSTNCDEVHYVFNLYESYDYRNAIYYTLADGKKLDDYKIKLATSVTNNEDGTYTLVEPIEILKKDWFTNYADYKNYYACDDFISETCSEMYYATNTDFYQMTHYNISNVYKYGNSFTYENGVYKLVDTKEFWNWSNNYNTLNNNHYTCFNSTGECEQIYYIYNTNNTAASYITLSGGKSVEDAINEMLYSEDVNQKNSTIKDAIDTWYEDNIIDVLDINSVLYSSYLEDTIWCNNREIKDLGGWNPNGGSTSTPLYFSHDSLECSTKTDQFTLKVGAGGTEGYGNNALDYPIGLVSVFEFNLVKSRGYLFSKTDFWSSTPAYFDGDVPRIAYKKNAGGWANNLVTTPCGVRPLVSLNLSVDIIDGDGSVTTPYQVVLSS